MRISDGEKVVAIAKVKSEKDEEKILEDRADDEVLESTNTQSMSENEKDDFENKFLNTFEDEDEEMQFESEQGLEDSEEKLKRMWYLTVNMYF